MWHQLRLGGVSCSRVTLVGGVKCKDIGVKTLVWSKVLMTGVCQWHSDYGRPDEQVKHPVKQTLASFM